MRSFVFFSTGFWSGAAVTGAAVIGAAVIGAAVTGAAVIGAAVIGAAVTPPFPNVSIYFQTNTTFTTLHIQSLSATCFDRFWPS